MQTPRIKQVTQVSDLTSLLKDKSNNNINNSAIKQELGTRRDPQGELMEEPNSTEEQELGTRRDPKSELMEKPDSNKAESANKLDPSSIKNFS